MYWAEYRVSYYVYPRVVIAAFADCHDKINVRSVPVGALRRLVYLNNGLRVTSFTIRTPDTLSLLPMRHHGTVVRPNEGSLDQIAMNGEDGF